jgi:1-deoxyxylulose-5-phosphate synthase
MKYAKLGRSELHIPRICLGSNNFGKQVEESKARKILETAFDLGVNMVDTANIYTGGASEEIIGRWAKGRRNDVTIATKVGMEDAKDTLRSGLSSENIEFQLKHSLERLETDYIDLYYVHQFDPVAPFVETLGTLEKLQRENVIRQIACSNLSARQLSDALEVSEKERFHSFIANQIPYSTFQRGVEEETLPFCKSNSIGVLAYSPLRSGLLAGRYKKDLPPPSDSRGAYRGKEFLDQVTTPENMSKLEKLEKIARSADMSLPVLSLAWVLRNEETVTAAVVGASNPEQFREAASAVDAKLSAEMIEEIDRVSR